MPWAQGCAGAAPFSFARVYDVCTIIVPHYLGMPWEKHHRTATE